MDVRLSLLGAPTVACDGESFALPFERRSQLLAYLALKRGWVARAELASLLWPEQEGKLAYTNLRKTLFRLQAQPWSQGLETQGSALRFVAATDVFAFESALHEQRAVDALPLRRGELLAGFDDDANDAWSNWLGHERDRLRAAWRHAMLDRLAGELEPGEGIALSTQLLDADPLDEAALRLHMAWLARNGQVPRARHAYHAYADRLAADLGLAPGLEIKALHDGLGTAAARPDPAASAASRPSDDDFVGRTVELRQIASRLAQDDCRLVSIVGPGGMGKTRLARRALAELAVRYADGGVFVPLDDVPSPSGIGARLARELGLTARGEAMPQVLEFLRDRQVLLVLDNLEHLAHDASALARLLDACPRLALIATSRVRLGIAPEWLLPLTGLPAPEPEDLDYIEAFDAARLFIRTARRVEPALVPEAEAAAIVDICRQVEGLPLALELAAAWTRVLSCAAIAAELREGTELLRSDEPSRPARHASMDVVFEQSWRLLAAAERDALPRLSVFRGGFTPEAARAVTGASLPVLVALADKSLLRKEGNRMQLHPLVQQLAALRFTDRAEEARAQAAHAAHFHHLLAQLRPSSKDGEREALRTIEAEFENIRQAWEFAVAAGQVDALARSVETLASHCDYRARFAEGLALLRHAADAPLAARNAPFAALLLSKIAQFEYRLDRYGDAQASAMRALEATRTRAASERGTRIQALQVLATCALHTGRLVEARRYFKQTLALSPSEVIAHNTAATLDHLALIEKRLGHFDEALRLCLDSLAQHRRIGDGAGVALCLCNLGSLYVLLNQHDAAAVHLQEALSLCERDGLVSTRVFVLANLADLAWKAEDLAASRTYAEKALAEAKANGMQAVATFMTLHVARLAVRRGELDAARASLLTVATQALTLGAPSLKAGALLLFAEIAEAAGALNVACAVLGFAMDEPSFSAPDRDELRDEWTRRTGAEAAGARAPPPALGLDDLLQRIIAETGVAHAPLMALLGGPFR